MSTIVDLLQIITKFFHNQKLFIVTKPDHNIKCSEVELSNEMGDANMKFWDTIITVLKLFLEYKMKLN